MRKTEVSKYVELEPFKLNRSIGEQYERQLMTIIKNMNKDIIDVITNEYENNINKIAMDASPAKILNDLINKTFGKWRTLLNNKSHAIAKNFVGNIENWSKRDIKRIIMKANIGITPTKNSRKLLNKQQAAIFENVSLITDLTDKEQTQITGAVMRAMENGRSLSDLKSAIKEIGIKGQNRVKLIANDQLSKISNTFNVQRSLDNGFTKARWYHSKGGESKRPLHVAATGTIFDLAVGCLIRGIYIQCGQEINCKCFYRLVYQIK